jgi:hypothetical protein
MFPIKNIPLPPGRRRHYPWEQLEVGQSFFIGKADSPGIANMRTSCWRASKKLKRKFAVVELENGDLQVGRLPDEPAVGSKKGKTPRK